jgi:predicted Zn finger-like uncharacterized protein
MIVQCPNCSTKFKFPDDKIKPGVKVRCSKCKNVFELGPGAQPGQSAPAPEPPAASPPPPPPPAPSAPPPPPPVPTAPAAPKAAEENFNFGDDIDFSAEAKPAPEPPASTERKPMTPAQKDYVGNFDGFQLNEDKAPAPPPPPPRREPPPPPPRREPEPEPEPASGKGPGGESEEFSFEDEADFSTEEFGAQAKAEKGMDLGFSAEMPEIPGGDKKSAKPSDSEPDFDEGMADFKIDRGEEPAPKAAARKDAGKSASASEEFDFGGKLESYARTDTIKTKHDASDELEADIDVETDGPPAAAAAATAAPVREAAKPAARPAAMSRPEPKRGPLLYLIIAGAVLVLGLVGALVFFNSKGTFTFSDLGKGNFSKLKTVPQIESVLVALGMIKPEIKGSVDLEKDALSVFNVQRNEGGAVLVVQGKVKNNYPASVRFVKVQVDLYDASKNLLATGFSYCDVNFTRNELAGMPESEIQGYMETKAGKNMNNLEIKAGEERDFSVVFFNPPKVVDRFDPKVQKNYELIK